MSQITLDALRGDESQAVHLAELMRQLENKLIGQAFGLTPAQLDAHVQPPARDQVIDLSPDEYGLSPLERAYPAVALISAFSEVKHG